VLGVHLGFDIVANIGPIRVGEREYFRQRRYPVAAHHFGPGKLTERPAAVERAELHQGEVVHELPDIWILRVAGEHGSGVGAFFRPDRLVVPHQRLASLVMTMSNSSVLTEFE